MQLSPEHWRQDGAGLGLTLLPLLGVGCLARRPIRKGPGRDRAWQVNTGVVQRITMQAASIGNPGLGASLC